MLPEYKRLHDLNEMFNKMGNQRRFSKDRNNDLIILTSKEYDKLNKILQLAKTKEFKMYEALRNINCEYYFGNMKIVKQDD